jgi:hypothetical protein
MTPTGGDFDFAITARFICLVARPELQPADDRVEGGEVVELESAQIRAIEVVPGHVNVITLPGRLLEFTISGGVQRHHAIVFLTRNGAHIAVRQREDEARRSRTRAA